MGERENKVREMIDEHEASFESLKESTKQYDDQINQYELDNKQKDMRIEKLTDERDTYAKGDRMLLEEYNKSIEQTEKEKEENAEAIKELEDKKRQIEKEVQEKMESFTRHDSILRQLTQEGMQIDTDIMQVKHDMQENLYKQQTFKIEYDQDGNPTNGMELAKFDKEYKELTDELRDLNVAKALCQEYIQKYHDELDNDVKKKYAIENEPPKQEPPKQEPPKQEPPKQELPKQEPPKQEPPKQEPPKQEPPKQEPPKQEPPKQEPPKQEPPKQEPPKQEPPKQEPPKQEPPKQEPPKQEPPKAININDLAEKIYGRMSPNQRSEIYSFMTGQIPKLGENTQPLFDEIQNRFGADTKHKIESYINNKAAKEFLKVTGIKTDVTTGMITVDFNCGEKFKPVAIDLRKFNKNRVHMDSIKNTKKAVSELSYDDTITDPYILRAIQDATYRQFTKLGLDITTQLDVKDIQKQVDLYQKALKTSKDGKPEDKKLDMNIEYVKSNEEKPIKVGRKKFEKVLIPFLKEAQESACVEIDDSIDTRTGKEKIKDALSAPWRWLTGKTKQLPAGKEKYQGKYLRKDDKSKENKLEEDKLKENATGKELENVGRTLGLDAQIKVMKSVPTGKIDENLTKEQEKDANEMLMKLAEERNSKPEAREDDRDDR